jgi:hypothetical protein
LKLLKVISKLILGLLKPEDETFAAYFMKVDGANLIQDLIMKNRYEESFFNFDMESYLIQAMSFLVANLIELKQPICDDNKTDLNST